jgi:hypothetical protein
MDFSTIPHSLTFVSLSPLPLLSLLVPPLSPGTLHIAHRFRLPLSLSLSLPQKETHPAYFRPFTLSIRKLHLLFISVACECEYAGEVGQVDLSGGQRAEGRGQREGSGRAGVAVAVALIIAVTLMRVLLRSAGRTTGTLLDYGVLYVFISLRTTFYLAEASPSDDVHPSNHHWHHFTAHQGR